MKLNFTDWGIEDKLTIFADGKAVVSFFEGILKKLEGQQPNEGGEKVIQPISLLLLDINIPIINGIEVCLRVKSMFKEYNESLALRHSQSSSEK